MRLGLFRARPVAVLAFAALLLGANLEPAVGMVREGDIHHGATAGDAQAVALGPSASPASAGSTVGRPSLASVDESGALGDHCAHGHGASMLAPCASIAVTPAQGPVPQQSAVARSCSLDPSVRPPIR